MSQTQKPYTITNEDVEYLQDIVDKDHFGSGGRSKMNLKMAIAIKEIQEKLQGEET